MADDRDCTRVVTVSGAMTVGKMGRVLCEMIDAGLAQIIVCTGAVMAHGLSEAIGCTHYKHDPRLGDKQLYDWGYNRVYDTLEMEANFWHAQELVSEVLSGWDWSQPACSWQINRELGRKLVEKGQMPSILGCAFRRDVPVYVPGVDRFRIGPGRGHLLPGAGISPRREADLEAFFTRAPSFNPFLDLCDYARRSFGAGRLGIFTVGGGVPRNWAQQAGPFADIINMRLGTKLTVPRFRYGVRICPEPVHWGGLSGCTYTEGVSWGKFMSRRGGRALRGGPLRRHRHLAAAGQGGAGGRRRAEGGRGRQGKAEGGGREGEGQTAARVPRQPSFPLPPSAFPLISNLQHDLAQQAAFLLERALLLEFMGLGGLGEFHHPADHGRSFPAASQRLISAAPFALLVAGALNMAKPRTRRP